MTTLTRRHFFALVGAGAAAALVPLPDLPAEPLAAEPVRRAGRRFRVERFEHRRGMLRVDLADRSSAYADEPLVFYGEIGAREAAASALASVRCMTLTVDPALMTGIGIGDVIMVEGMG